MPRYGKTTSFFFEKEDDILPLFEQQLEKTGVSYFDYYLLHALNGAYYEKFTRCNAFEIVKQLKEQGRVKHIGISFHDKPALLDRVLDEHPEIEVVQIQFNYADYENPSIESRAVYEVCRRHQKPVIVMEPVKGGDLSSCRRRRRRCWTAWEREATPAMPCATRLPLRGCSWC